MLPLNQFISCINCENFRKQLSTIHTEYDVKIRALNMDNEILKIQIQKICQNGIEIPQPDFKNEIAKLTKMNENLGRELKRLKLENEKQNQSKETCASCNQAIQEVLNRFSQLDALSNDQSNQTATNSNNNIANRFAKMEAALDRERKWSQNINDNYTKLLAETDALKVHNNELKENLQSAERKINNLLAKGSRNKARKTTLDKITDDKDVKGQPRSDYVKKICNTPFYKENKKAILEIEKCFEKFPILPLEKIPKIDVANVTKKRSDKNTKTTKVKDKMLTNKRIHNVSGKTVDGDSKNKETSEISDIIDLSSLDDSDDSVTPSIRNPFTNDENLSKKSRKNTDKEIENNEIKFSHAGKRNNSDDKNLSDSDSSCDVSLFNENYQTDRKNKAPTVDSHHKENQTAQSEVNIKKNDTDKVIKDYLFDGFFDQNNSTSPIKNPSVTCADPRENHNENHPNRCNNTKELESRIENNQRTETSISDTLSENISKSCELSSSFEDKQMDNKNHQTKIDRHSKQKNKNKIRSDKSLTNDLFYSDETNNTQSKSIPKSIQNEDVSMGIHQFRKAKNKNSKKKYYSIKVDLDESENYDEPNDSIDATEETSINPDKLTKDSQPDNILQTTPISNKSPIEEENEKNVNESEMSNDENTIENQERKSEKIVLPKRKIDFEDFQSAKKRKLNNANDKITKLDQSFPNKPVSLSVIEGNIDHGRQSVIDNPGSPMVNNQPEPDNLRPNDDQSNAFVDIDFANPVFIMDSDLFSMKLPEASDELIDQTTSPKANLLTSNPNNILIQLENSPDKETLFDNPFLQIDNQTESDNPIIFMDIPDDLIMNFDTICNSTKYQATQKESISESQCIAARSLPSDTNSVQDYTNKSIENQDLINSHISSPIINQPETNNSNLDDQQWSSLKDIDFHNSNFSFVDSDVTEPMGTNFLSSDPQEPVKDSLEKSSKESKNKLSEDIDQSKSINYEIQETSYNEIDTTEKKDYNENNNHQNREWKFFDTEDVMEMRWPCDDDITLITEFESALPLAVFTNSESNKENENVKRNVDPSESLENSSIIEHSRLDENMDCDVAESDRRNESIINDNTGKENEDQHENKENNDKKPNSVWQFNIDEDFMATTFNNDFSFSTDLVMNLSFQISNDMEISEENNKPETKRNDNLPPEKVLQPQTSIFSIGNVSNQSLKVSSRKPNPGDLKPLEIRPDSRINQKEQNILIRKIKKLLALCVAKKFNFTPVFRGCNFPSGSECLFDLFLTNTFIFVSDKTKNYSIKNLTTFLPRINQIMSNFLNLCCDKNRGLAIFGIRLIDWVQKLPLKKINFASVRLMLCIAFDFHWSLNRSDLSVTVIIDLLEYCRVPAATIISAIDLKFIDYSDPLIEHFQINVLITFLKFLLHYENRYCRYDTSACPLSEKGQEFWLRGMTDYPQATIVEYLRDQLVRHPDCLSLINLLYSVVLKRCTY